MKKYKLGYQIYLTLIGTILVLLPDLLWKELGIVRYIISMPIIIVQCINVICTKIFIYISINEKGIRSKTIMSNRYMEWEKIHKVCKARDIPLHKYTISVIGIGIGNEIKISSWTKDSKELIKIIVDECKKRDIYVELMVEKIIED